MSHEHHQLDQSGGVRGIRADDSDESEGDPEPRLNFDRDAEESETNHVRAELLRGKRACRMRMAPACASFKVRVGMAA